jgi:hypothetical protein
MSVAEHKAHSPARVACFVLTVSDTRTMETETSGRAIAELLEMSGHAVAAARRARQAADVARVFGRRSPRVEAASPQAAPASRSATRPMRRWRRCSRSSSTDSAG